MAANQTSSSRPKGRRRADGWQQSTIRRCRVVDRKNRGAMARSARAIRQMELGVSTLQSLVQARGVAAVDGTNWGRPGFGALAPGFDHRASPPACRWRKRGVGNQAFGRSRGGWSTKIHAAVNDDGQPVRFSLTGGERHDMVEAGTLLENLSLQYVVADKGYDSDSLRQQIRRQGGKPVIPARTGIRRRRYDRTRYRLRNVIERFFNRVKHYRRVATRYEKTDRNYLGFVCLASLMATS